MAAKKKLNLDQILSTNLRKLREKRGHSQEDLAVLAGVTQGTISAIEGGLRSPSMGMIAKLASALGVQGRELLK